MERINKIGVELEGGFTKIRHKIYYHGYDPDSERPQRTSDADIMANKCWHNDSSVSTSQPANGEVVSPPIGEIIPLTKWIQEHYPDEVNKSCGFHIHISLKSNLDYSRLMSKAFYRHFLNSWEKWGKKLNIKNEHFWERLNGKNTSYCKRKFENPDLQAQSVGDRYHQLNFCYKKHGTFENRMLPMFKEQDIAIKALTHYVNMVEGWLKLQKKEVPITDLITPDEEQSEVIKEIVCV